MRLFGSDGHFDIRVDADDTLLVHGFSGGTLFGTVQGVWGPLASFLADLNPVATGDFFLNDCLMGGAAVCNQIGSIFDASRTHIDLPGDDEPGGEEETADLRHDG